MIYIGVLIINITQPDQSDVHRSTTYVPFPVPETYKPQPGDILVSCQKCGWQNIYQSAERARRGMAGHQGWCRKQSSRA